MTKRRRRPKKLLRHGLKQSNHKVERIHPHKMHGRKHSHSHYFVAVDRREATKSNSQYSTQHTLKNVITGPKDEWKKWASLWHFVTGRRIFHQRKK